MTSQRPGGLNRAASPRTVLPGLRWSPCPRCGALVLVVAPAADALCGRCAPLWRVRRRDPSQAASA
jgi:hypothetical protein